MKFRDLDIGDYFKFAPPKVGYGSFFSTCKKVSAACYTYRGRAYVKRRGKLVIEDGVTLKNRCSINSDVVRNSVESY